MHAVQISLSDNTVKRWVETGDWNGLEGDLNVLFLFQLVVSESL